MAGIGNDGGLTWSLISPKTLQPVPAVAKSWTIGSAGKVFTFHIRPGVRFSDGNPLTAADVAWTMTNYANPKISPVVASFYNQMVSATAVNPLTLRVGQATVCPVSGQRRANVYPRKEGVRASENRQGQLGHQLLFNGRSAPVPG